MRKNLYLYRHFDENGKLLYVGQTNNIWRRTEYHFFIAPWRNAVARITAERYPTRSALIQAEQKAIQEENPTYNSRWRTQVQPVPILPKIPPASEAAKRAINARSFRLSSASEDNSDAKRSAIEALGKARTRGA